MATQYLAPLRGALEICTSPQHNIVRLDVTMNDSNLVEGLELLEQLDAHAYGLIFSKHRGFLNHLSFIDTDRELLHHEELRVTVNLKNFWLLIGEQTKIQNSGKLVHLDLFVDPLQIFDLALRLCSFYNFDHNRSWAILVIQLLAIKDFTEWTFTNTFLDRVFFSWNQPYDLILSVIVFHFLMSIVPRVNYN